MRTARNKVADSMAQVDLSGLKQPLVTIYKSPADFQGVYGARIWEGTGPKPTDTVVIRDTLEELRKDIMAAGFTECFPRAAGDDPHIVETYIQ